MYKLGTTVVIFLLVGPTWGQSQKTDKTLESPGGSVRSVREMQTLYDAFVGSWRVTETFEVAAGTSRQGKTRRGAASFRAGPANSLIEEYRSTGSAGSLSFLAVLWWDQPAQIYRLLTCANNDGCHLRGTAKWEGRKFVNSWDENVDGKTVTFKDSLVDITRSSFQLVSEGTAGGKTIWRVITKYQRTT